MTAQLEPPPAPACFSWCDHQHDYPGDWDEIHRTDEVLEAYRICQKTIPVVLDHVSMEQATVTAQRYALWESSDYPHDDQAAYVQFEWPGLVELTPEQALRLADTLREAAGMARGAGPGDA